jgi:hypothetical protein
VVSDTMRSADTAREMINPFLQSARVHKFDSILHEFFGGFVLLLRKKIQFARASFAVGMWLRFVRCNFC